MSCSQCGNACANFDPGEVGVQDKPGAAALVLVRGPAAQGPPYCHPISVKYREYISTTHWGTS
jgi:hypothetical protein